MPAREICPNIYWIGVNDRTTDLFEPRILDETETVERPVRIGE